MDGVGNGLHVPIFATGCRGSCLSVPHGVRHPCSAPERKNDRLKRGLGKYVDCLVIHRGLWLFAKLKLGRWLAGQSTKEDTRLDNKSPAPLL